MNDQHVYPSNHTVRFTASLYDTDGSALTGASGTLYYEKPDGTTGNTAFTEVSSGVYRATLTTTTVYGTWHTQSQFIYSSISVSKDYWFRVEKNLAVNAY